MSEGAFGEAARLIREDAARWVRPQDVADVDEVTPQVLLKLLVRHVPLRAMVWFRLAGAARKAGIRGVASWTQRRMLLKYGFEIAPGAQVGGGLYVAHPVGCVLHAERIGRNVSIVGSVTFGVRNDFRWPIVEDDVFVGAGAKVIGGVTVGAGATVGANAVVLHDVPPGHVAVGIPARTRPRTPDA